MLRAAELPDCFYSNKPMLIKPCSDTPMHSLYLSNLDDQKFLRFSIKYIYLFKKSVNRDSLKVSLSRVLVDYYPLAGRLKVSSENDQKLELECNGEGAVFAEAFMDLTADEFTQVFHNPNKTWRKLLYKVDATSFLDIPPLIIQVTNLRCGAMILCTAINHCLCDGIGTSQFLHAWAHLTRSPNTDLLITPFHFRHVLKPRNPPQVTFSHPTFTKSQPHDCIPQKPLNLSQYLQSQPLIPASLTFASTHILHLKRQCVPSLKCTTFEALASHTWRCWAKSLDLPPSATLKLLFSVNVRKTLMKYPDQLPQGYYGNAFVLACAEAMVKDVAADNLHNGLKMVQHAKSTLTDDYVKSIIDHLDDKTLRTDLSCSLVISQWSRLGLEDLDFGEGKSLLMGPLTSDIYCLFLPVIGDRDAVRVLVSMPESIVSKFKYYMTEFSDGERNEDANGHSITDV